ncbi:MAG: GDSL-type esterase/lipase family protein [Firmicutes bacterium]|nr:GDSL-type esterase/lipase family protein [Bacillota bacterium]
MHRQDIPDIEIIDLDTDIAAKNTVDDGNNGAAADDADTDTDDGDSDKNTDDDTDDTAARKPSRSGKFRLNVHMVLLAVVVLTFSYIFYKYVNFGQIVEQDKDPSEAEDYTLESYDNILALTDEAGNVIAPDLEDGLSIAVFGNGPFAEDRDSDEGLAGMLAKTTGATVYNCAIDGSRLASSVPGGPNMDINPWDAFSFYWMSFYSTDVELIDFYGRALETLGTDTPPELLEVREIFSTLDFDTIDVIVIMYDASDYFAGAPAAPTEDLDVIQSFTGNLEAGLKVLREHHPNTRIIVMSPTYAFSDQLDENGDYISSDIVRYGQDNLSTYISKAAETCSAEQVSFVDNFYVTFNEDNASNYLTDNMHLNSEGRKKVIERLVYALNYYDAFYE